MTTLKVVVVGDAAVGKTSLIVTYTTNSFPEDYIATGFTDSPFYTIIDGDVATITFYESPGQDYYDRWRPLAYRQADVVLMCYSVDSPVSLKNIKAKWIPELDCVGPKIPRVLVACKSDLITPSADCSIIVRNEDGEEVARELSIPHFTTSSLLHVGVGECMMDSLRVGVAGAKKSSTKGILNRISKYFGSSHRQSSSSSFYIDAQYE